MVKWLRHIGLAGIRANENTKAQLCHDILEWPMMAAALWALAVIYMHSIGEQPQGEVNADLLIWGLFVTETALLCLLTDRPKQYLRDNWLNLVIIVVGLPLLFDQVLIGAALRTLRLLVLFSLLVHVLGYVSRLLSRNSLLPTFIGLTIVIVMAGYMMAAIDPAISTPSEGIWWAWVTITTVGYGDVVPESAFGKAFAGILILIGIGIVALLTAIMAASFVDEKEEKISAEQMAEKQRIEQLEQQLQRLEDKLDELLQSVRKE